MSTVYKGVDISKYNTKIDYAKLSKEVNFAIIRVGYRGWGSAGTLKTDELFKTHIEGCTKNNIPVSVYWLAQEINEMEAIAAANYVYNLIKNYKISLPIYYDSELSTADRSKGEIGRADNISKNERTRATIAFCKRIEAFGYKAGVYASENWFDTYLNFSQIKNYHIWVAKYSSNKPSTSVYDIWQYSEKGSVNGITGKVDVNYMYKNIIQQQTTTQPSTTKTTTTTYKKWAGYVTANTLNIRAKANINGDILGTFSNGTAVTIEGESGDFYKITYKNKTAYISKKYVSTKKPDISWTGVVTANALNVRANASTSSNILGVLKKGATTKITGSSGDFYKTIYKNKTAYVAKKYIKKK